MHSTRDSVRDLGKKTFRIWEVPFDSPPRLVHFPGLSRFTETGHVSRARDGTIAFDSGAPPIPRLPSAAKYVSMLADADPDARKRAERGLLKLGGVAVPDLVALLVSSSYGDAGGATLVAERAAETLAWMHKRAVSAVPILFTAFERSEGDAKRVLAAALGGIAPHASEYWRRRLRSRTAEFLERAKPAGHGTIDPEGLVAEVLRLHARTLFDPWGPLVEVVEALDHPNPFVRELAAEVLPLRMGHGDEVIAALARVAEATHPRTVVVLGPSGRIAFEVEADEQVRRAAVLAIEEFAQRRDEDRRKHNIFRGEPSLYWTTF